MHTAVDNVKHSVIQDFLKSGALLGFYKGSLVLPTQPIQVVMRHQQGSLAKGTNPLSFVQALRDCSAKSPRVVGVPTHLFRGCVPAIGKEVFKNGTYKAWLLKGAPTLVSRYATNSVVRSWTPWTQHLSIAWFAAAIAATADTYIGGPLERFATYRATSQAENKDASFMAELAERKTWRKKLSYLYKGSAATWLKVNIACLSLFTFGAPAKSFIYRVNNLAAGDEVPFSVSAQCALLTGFAVSLVSSPFDIIKTIKQMPRSSSDEGVMTVLRNNIKKFGVRAVTTGLPAKIALITLGWGAVSLVIQRSSRVPENENDNMYSYSPGKG